MLSLNLVEEGSHVAAKSLILDRVLPSLLTFPMLPQVMQQAVILQSLLVGKQILFD